MALPGRLKTKPTKKSGKRRFSLFGGKLTLHPLFLLVGAVQCFTGELLSFLLVVICALLHELAHAYAGAQLGYKLNRIVLMPFGAMLDSDLVDLPVKDEIFVALAGPLCNLLCAALFLAVWWCFPVAYAYTDTAFFATLSLGLCNLLPAYPLDGGRVLRALVYQAFNAYMPPSKAEKRANFIVKTVAVLITALLLFLFLITAFETKPNWTILSFSLFLLFGIFQHRNTAYERIDFSLQEAFSRGVAVKHVAAFEDCTVKRALTFLSHGEYLILDVYTKNERYLGTVTQNELSKFFLKNGLYAKLGAFFG